MNVYVCVAGVGGVLVFSPSYVAVSQWFDKKKGKAMAWSTIGSLDCALLLLYPRKSCDVL